MSVGALGMLARLALVAIMAMRIGFWVYGLSVCRRDRRGEAAVFLAVTVVLVAIEVAAIGYLGGW